MEALHKDNPDERKRKRRKVTQTKPTLAVVLRKPKAMIAINSKKIKGKQGNDAVSAGSKKALQRGGGHALVKHHGYGCRHYGIMDLPVMTEKRFLNYYSQEGKWFYNAKCSDCETKTQDLKPQKGSGAILYYCEMGVKSESIDAEGEKESYNAHTCDCILCPACHQKRLEQHYAGSSITGRISRTRCNPLQKC